MPCLEPVAVATTFFFLIQGVSSSILTSRRRLIFFFFFFNVVVVLRIVTLFQTSDNYNFSQPQCMQLKVLENRFSRWGTADAEITIPSAMNLSVLK